MAEPRKKPSQRRVNRRLALQVIAALAASGWLPRSMAQSAPAIAPKSFTAASLAYTGYTFDDFRVANAMLSALNASVGAANLRKLAILAARTPAGELDAALQSAGLERAAEIVVTALYTGTVESPKGTIVVSYDQALVWQAIGWTKPNAFCGGPTNYWANPPANAT